MNLETLLPHLGFTLHRIYDRPPGKACQFTNRCCVYGRVKRIYKDFVTCNGYDYTYEQESNLPTGFKGGNRVDRTLYPVTYPMLDSNQRVADFKSAA